jgi:hypothetical protein
MDIAFAGRSAEARIKLSAAQIVLTIEIIPKAWKKGIGQKIFPWLAAQERYELWRPCGGENEFLGSTHESQPFVRKMGLGVPVLPEVCITRI